MLDVPVELTSVPPGPSNIENYAYGIEELLLKTQLGEKFLHSEVK
jgi:hypothetical protein